jgi:hypothetical protein
MPRIKTTRTVTFALILLRVYLLAMLLIILYKFVLEAWWRSSHAVRPPAATAQDTGPAGESANRDSATAPPSTSAP